jgi:hypothetical protein
MGVIGGLIPSAANELVRFNQPLVYQRGLQHFEVPPPYRETADFIMRCWNDYSTMSGSPRKTATIQNVSVILDRYSIESWFVECC